MSATAGVRHLHVRNLGQVEEADLEFGDLTVLVGPQATGKSLLLQCLALAVDGLAVRRTLRENGIQSHDWREFLRVFFGEELKSLWTNATAVRFDGVPIDSGLVRKRSGLDMAKHRLVYIPAQRTLALPDGFPRRFREFGPDTPFVVRRYSSLLHESLVNGRYEIKGRLFPNTGRLRAPLRNQIVDSVFHGAELLIDRKSKVQDLRLALPDGSQLPIMTWTAGQREFIPLLLGLYPLLPAGKISREPDVDWIVLEEPEMGLHPSAIITVMNLVVSLVARGYRVVLSSHHPLVLDVVWAINQLRDSQDNRAGRQLCKALGGASDGGLVKASTIMLSKSTRVHALDYLDVSLVRSFDISSLDPSALDEVVRGWGGLTGVSARLLDAVAAVNA